MSEEKTALLDDMILYNAQERIRQSCVRNIKSGRNGPARKSVLCRFSYNPSDKSMSCIVCSDFWSSEEIRATGRVFDNWLNTAGTKDTFTIEAEMSCNRILYNKKEIFDMFYNNETNGRQKETCNPKDLINSYGGGFYIDGEWVYVDGVFDLTRTDLFTKIITVKKTDDDKRFNIAKAFLKKKFEQYLEYLDDLKIGKEKIEKMFTKD